MNTQSTVIVGNALSGMMSALALAKQGQQVTLINPGGPLGGYFGGIESGGFLFDAGLVKLELDGYSNQMKMSDLSDYDPEVRNDVGRFLNVVRNWAMQYVELNELTMPKMMIEGSTYDDVILSNAYHAFSQLPFAAQSVSELQGSSPAPEIHARNKSSGEAYETLDYATASIANHGKTMHEKIIAPYLKKAMGVTADQLLARYHRVPWLPLFYPETLLDAFKGQPVGLTPTKFHYPKSSNVAKLVGMVKQELLESPNVTYITEQIKKITKTEDGWNIQCNQLNENFKHMVWTYQPSQLLKALGQTPTPVTETKAPLGILLLRIKKTDARDVHSLLHVVDLNHAIYRITNQSACADDPSDFMNISAEFNLDYFSQMYGKSDQDDFIIQQLLGELAKMNLVVADLTPVHAAIKRIPVGFLIPNAVARDAWESDHQRIKNEYPEIVLLAMASGFFATSLNDQVVQGLHYAHTRRLQDNTKTNMEGALCL